MHRKTRWNPIIAAAGALLALSTGAQAQNYEISLNSNPLGEGIIAVPGQEVLISVWLTGGQNIANFSGWSTFGVELHINGAVDIGGFQQSTGGIYTEDPNETMPNPSSGWVPDPVPDTWVAGRRPGTGAAIGGGFFNDGWRFSPSVASNPVSFGAVPTANGLQVIQAADGSPSNSVLTGRQINSSFIPSLSPEHLNVESDVEILRFLYTPTTIGNQTVQVDTMGAFAFFNNSFGGAVTVLPQMLPGSQAVITVIPAPGAFALLTLGGLAAARRRR